MVSESRLFWFRNRYVLVSESLQFWLLNRSFWFLNRNCLVSAAGDDRYEHHVNFKRGLLGVRQQTSSIQGSKDKKQKAGRRQAGFLVFLRFFFQSSSASASSSSSSFSPFLHLPSFLRMHYPCPARPKTFWPHVKSDSSPCKIIGFAGKTYRLTQITHTHIYIY